MIFSRILINKLYKKSMAGKDRIKGYFWPKSGKRRNIKMIDWLSPYKFDMNLWVIQQNICKDKARQMHQTLLLVTAILLVSNVYALPCTYGEVFVNSACLKCAEIPHAKLNPLSQQLFQDKCLCEEGYAWSQNNLGCQLKQQRKPQEDGLESQIQENSFSSAKRLLQATTCDTARGFIAYVIKSDTTRPSICLNCRLIPGSEGTAADQLKCGCSRGGTYMTSFQSTTDSWNNWDNCYTYQSDPFFFDATTQKRGYCYSLSSAIVAPATTSLQSDCIGGVKQFIMNRFGKVRCTTIRNAVYTTTCTCATGYTLSWHTSRCQCANGYFRNAAGNCVICPTADSTMCSTSQCRLKYVRDNYQCVLGTLIGVLPATGACDATKTLKRNPYDSRIISCGCSLATGYFLNGAACSLCSSIQTLFPAAAITTAQCTDCSSNRMAKTTVECVYCANVANNLDGTSTVNGCNCRVGFFWNTNTASCQCDYADGLILIGTACFDCKAVPNSQNIVDFPFNACSCRTGFIWNATSRTCVCDAASGNTFLNGTTCINCVTIIGGNGKVAAANACNCNRGYIWNAATLSCVCNSAQNYVLVNGVCIACWSITGSNGLINTARTGCVCGLGFKWSSLGCVSCSALGTDLLVKGSCVACSSLSSGLIASCTSCSNAAGYAAKNNFCYDCLNQYGVTGSTVTAGQCTCPASMNWSPEFGGCVCKTYVNEGFISTYNLTLTSANKWTCQQWWFTSTNGCGGSSLTTKYIWTVDICHLCTSDPNNAPSVNASQPDFCKCKPGFVLNLVNVPFGCVVAQTNCNFVNSLYLTGSSCNACSTLAAAGTPSLNNCLTCSSAGGFIQRINSVGTTQCILCSTLTGGGTTGVASENGCVCASGRTWSPTEVRCL